MHSSEDHYLESTVEVCPLESMLTTHHVESVLVILPRRISAGPSLPGIHTGSLPTGIHVVLPPRRGSAGPAQWVDPPPSWSSQSDDLIK